MTVAVTVFRPPSAALRQTALHLENIKFSHSIFAMPFALAGASLAARDVDPAAWRPDTRTLLLVVAAVVAARTAAMAANRVLDAGLDAANPRTRARPIPAGALSRGAVATVGGAAALGFVGVAFALSPLCGALSPIVLAVLVGYSLFKRFTSLAHAVLGLSLGLAPAGAWLAVRGDFGGNVAIPVLLGLAVLCWVAGFDLIYACQDADHDRAAGLHSVPARIGVAGALALSTALHVAATGLFVAVGVAAGLGILYYVSVGLVCALLAAEHAIVRPGDLTRVNAAFFTLNGWVSVGFFLGLTADLWRGLPA